MLIPMGFLWINSLAASSWFSTFSSNSASDDGQFVHINIELPLVIGIIHIFLLIEGDHIV